MRVFNQRSFPASVVVCLLLLLLVSAVGAQDSVRRGERIAIVTGEQLEPRQQMAVDDLTSFLQRSLAAVVRWYPDTVSLEALEEDAVVVFAEAADNEALGRLARQADVTLATSELGDEGLLVRSAVVNGKPVVFLTGKTLTGACHAAYSFLEDDVGIGFFVDQNRVPKLQELDLGNIQRSEIPAVPIRGLFYHPTWKHPHANSWRLWSWEGSKKKIDWLRRKRFSVLPLFHDEGGYLWGDVIFKTFPRLRINDKSLSQFVVDPTWRTRLNKKMFQYVRDSGLKVAYNLFYSQVPEFFADFYPELKYHPLNMRNVGISAIQPECREIMKKYWGAILDTYGIDDSHLYFICSYQHERSLPAYYNDRNQTTVQAYEVLRELDPKAEMYIETWCWKYRHECPEPYAPCPQRSNITLTENPIREWTIFNEGVPRDIGVAEWDLRTNPKRTPDPTFDGRPYVQLTHTNMEGWWPPTTTRRSPRWLIDYFGSAMDNGARGVLYFHIQGPVNSISADLASRIGWERRPDLQTFYRDYAARRFGQDASDTMAESFSSLCDAIDSRVGENQKFTYRAALVFPGFNGSGEQILEKALAAGDVNETWLEDRLAYFEEKAALVSRAQLLARAVAPRMKDDYFFEHYAWELDYVTARIEGIQNLYKAHLKAGSDPDVATRHFHRSTDAFTAVREMFRNKPGHHMSKIRDLEPDVPYTAAFLRDWETRGYWQPKVQWFHVVWERLDEFEGRLHALKPAELR